MKWYISSWLFTKLDDFLPVVIYMVEWSLHNITLCFLLIYNSWKIEIWFLSITEPCTPNLFYKNFTNTIFHLTCNMRQKSYEQGFSSNLFLEIVLKQWTIYLCKIYLPVHFLSSFSTKKLSQNSKIT